MFGYMCFQLNCVVLKNFCLQSEFSIYLSMASFSVVVVEEEGLL